MRNEPTFFDDLIRHSRKTWVISGFVALLALFLLYQNCGSGFGVDGLSILGSSLSEDSFAFPDLARAEDSLRTAQLNGVPPNQLAALGPCSLRDSDGRYLGIVIVRTEPECQQACDAFQASRPGRECIWKDKYLTPPRQALCVIKGGAHAELQAPFQATESKCREICESHSNSPYRYCDWGTDRIHSPPLTTVCRVRGGAGAVLQPPVYSSQSDCANLCSSFASNLYRTCIYGDIVLQTPSDASRCEIYGGAQRMLTPPFYGDSTACSKRCDEFTANSNRLCFYGGRQFR